MANCCDYDREFSSRVARADLRRYRKRGLNRLERQIVDQVTRFGLGGRSLLEVGGGIGALHVEFLAAGASEIDNVDMSSEYEAAAADLLATAGLAGRVRRHTADFAESGDIVRSADVVIMNRVICCYPNVARLLDAALGKTRHLLVVTFPRDRRLVRLIWGTERLLQRLKGAGFRAYLHPPAEIFRRAESHGADVAFHARSLMWHTVVFERSAH